MYYTDDIGNISTSNAFRDVENNVVSLEIRPRFAIFGGWKTNWVIGYNFPTYHYLF
jgi:oligosaccharyltransferase complex subunit alpha (ribophorin I)